MTLHLVLDHSALIPYGNKPQEEKEAIRRLGGMLPELDAVWYVSREYFKTLHAVCSKELKQHHPLPRLHSSLMRGLRNLLILANTKASWCKRKVLEGTKLILHVVARSALEHVGFQEELRGLSDEDLEVLAIAKISTHYASPIYVVTADEPLLQAAARLARSEGLKIEALTPKQLEQLIESNK